VAFPAPVLASGPWNDHDPPVRLLADRLGRDIGMVAQRQVNPAPLEGRHRLELEHLAGLDDPLRRPLRDLAELTLASPAVVLHVHQDAGPRPDLP